MNNGRDTRIRTMVIGALLAALVCASTLSIRIPTPGTGGYIHPGDAFVILSGVILGPGWGMLAGGIGSALADMLGGYFIYVPITFVIKGLVSMTAGLIYRQVGRSAKTRHLAVLLGGVADILLVGFGYLLCESVMYGFAAAVASFPANLVQGVSGLIISMVLYPILFAIPDVRQTAGRYKDA